jgi:prevent-host-death family protein
MKPLRASDSIVPIGEFKTHASRLVRAVREHGRPVVITQHGRPAAVLVSPQDYDRLTVHHRFLAAVQSGLADAAAGRTLDDDELDQVLDDEFGPTV